MDIVCENVGIDTEAESTLFKAHRKRKNNINTSDSKFDKKMDSQMLNAKVRVI